MSRSSSASAAAPAFVAHALCPPHLRTMVEDAVEAFDSAWLLPPQQGELFDNPKACLRRLQGYALSQGFAVVITSSKKTRALFACIHHDAETRNWRGLEKYIKRNAKSNILNNRKRKNIAANAKDYI